MFLGLEDGQPLFAVATGRRATSRRLAALGEFRDMRAAAFVLPDPDTAIAGQAKALIDWHRRHGFCPNCGHATDIPAMAAIAGFARIAAPNIFPAPIRW